MIKVTSWAEMQARDGLRSGRPKCGLALLSGGSPSRCLFPSAPSPPVSAPSGAGPPDAVSVSPAERKPAPYSGAGGGGAGLGGHRWENGPGLLAPAQQLVFSKHLLYTAARLDSAISKTWNPDFPSQKGPRLLSRSGCLCRDEWLSWHMGRW